VEHGLQRRVRDPRDVADRSIDIAQILNGRWIFENLRRNSFLRSPAYRLQMDQAEGLVVVFVDRIGAVAVLDQYALALGVVIDIRDEGCPEWLATRLRAAQVDVDLFQQTGFVVGRPVSAVVRRRGRGDAVQRVIGGGAGEGFGFERGALRPVRRVLVVARELTRAAQGVAFEIVEIGGDDAGAVIMTEGLAA
jgi:hypothetical protein